MASSPIENSDKIFSFEVFSDGKVIKDSVLIKSIEVDRSIFKTPSAKITIQIPTGDNDDFSDFDSDDFTPGRAVKISLGYNENNTTVFIGKISRISIHTTSGNELAMEVHCNEQMEEWESVVDRAKADKMVAYIQHDQVVVEKPETSDQADFVVTYGLDVIQFDCGFTSEAHKNGNSMTGTISFLGNATPKLNSLLTLSGFGKRFNRNVLVISIKHTVGEGFWETTAGLGFPPDWSDKDKSIVVKDTNGNALEMTTSGINLSSTKDITIKSDGKISLEAVSGVKATASNGDVDLKGLNVHARADIAFSGKGNATAELSASGQTTVKGAIVMIN